MRLGICSYVCGSQKEREVNGGRSELCSSHLSPAHEQEAQGRHHGKPHSCSVCGGDNTALKDKRKMLSVPVPPQSGKNVVTRSVKGRNQHPGRRRTPQRNLSVGCTLTLDVSYTKARLWGAGMQLSW